MTATPSRLVTVKALFYRAVITRLDQSRICRFTSALPVTASSVQKLLRKILVPNIGTVTTVRTTATALRRSTPTCCDSCEQPPRAAATYVPVCRRIPPLLCSGPCGCLEPRCAAFTRAYKARGLSKLYSRTGAIASISLPPCPDA